VTLFGMTNCHWRQRLGSVASPLRPTTPPKLPVGASTRYLLPYGVGEIRKTPPRRYIATYTMTVAANAHTCQMAYFWLNFAFISLFMSFYELGALNIALIKGILRHKEAALQAILENQEMFV
jgi:hypothetical protein